MKRLIHEIHEGKNLSQNLVKWKEESVSVYLEYVSLELTFSAYMLLQEIVEERETLAPMEKATVDEVLAALGELGEKREGSSGIVQRMRKLRCDITDKMDLFTAYTDRLIGYEYVLNRMELKYLTNKELDAKLSFFDEEAYLKLLLNYLFCDEDNSVIQEKLRFVLGQLPVHMTKNKLFDRIRESFTLYRGESKSSLDDYMYMLRTSAMVYQPQKYVGKYIGLESALREIETADYTQISKEEYDHLAECMEEGAREVHSLTDLYYSLQKTVNCIYAMAILNSYESDESSLVRACRSIWICLSQKEYRDEMLYPLEGRIEQKLQETSYLESILPEIKSSYESELREWELLSFYDDLLTVANLMSDSLFMDLNRTGERECADDNYIRRCEQELFAELSEKMSEVSRPVKKAIMAQVLNKLPLAFKTSNEVKEYIRTNLFGCQDKAEKITVMTLLGEVIEQEMRD